MIAIHGTYSDIDMRGGSPHAPDSFIGKPGMHPDGDFVLCYDESGIPTAVYSSNTWDFNPYRLTAEKINNLIFELDDDTKFSNPTLKHEIIVDLKYISFLLMYFARSGRNGKLSVGGIQSYFSKLKQIAVWCYENRENKFLKGVKVSDVLSNRAYLSAYIRDQKCLGNRGNSISAVLTHLRKMDESRVGFSPLNYNFKKESSKQTPIIPFRIYSQIGSMLACELEPYISKKKEIGLFIRKMEDPYYGLCKYNQTNKYKVPKNQIKPTFGMALTQANLQDELKCIDRKQFVSELTQIQWLIFNTIIYYTGMRKGEAQRILFNCISRKNPRESVSVPLGDKPPVKMVSVISSTTKFSGYKKEASWLACDDAIKAVELGQEITEAIAYLHREKADVCYLFSKPTIISYKKEKRGKPEVAVFKPSHKEVLNNEETIIRDNDFELLAASDPDRDFSLEPEFAVGSYWNIKPHQYRRSLAFYGAASGLVSLTSLKRQFKHLTREMTQFYQKGFENIAMTFGYFDEEKKNFVLPTDHMAFEFQTAIPLAMCDLLLKDVFLSEERIYGASSDPINNQIEMLNSGEIAIADCRSTTEKMADRGEISYRKTPLGGCLKVESCDYYIFGEITECLSCSKSVIKVSNLESVIKETEDDLSKYEEGSGEWKIIRDDLSKFTEFQKKFLNTENTEKEE